MGLVQKPVSILLCSEASGSDINPYEVGSLKWTNLPVREVLCGEITECSVIIPDIAIQLVQPVLTVIVGRHQGYGSEGVHVAHLVDIDSTIETSAPRWLCTDDIGYLKSGDIE
jgi:hypothetical protein